MRKADPSMIFLEGPGLSPLSVSEFAAFFRL